MPLVVRVFLVVDFSASFMPIVAKNLSNIEDIDVGLVCVIPSDIKLVTLSLRGLLPGIASLTDFHRSLGLFRESLIRLQ